MFHKIISITNLLKAWKNFKQGKSKKEDCTEFSLHLEDSLFKLQKSLINKTYTHLPYTDFFVSDPKRRHIHKATIRDRILHQAVFQVLYPIFDKHFMYNSYSSRLDKGIHKGFERLHVSCRKVTANWCKPAYALKCDIRKFFDSIDHVLLVKFLEKYVHDIDTFWLINIFLSSFEKQKGKGIPLGNVTSQLFSNVYLNNFDQFVKHKLKCKYYFRYVDDFIILNESKEELENILVCVAQFLKHNLLLDLHPNKVEIRKISQGIDFLGYVSLPHAVILRTKTGKRIIKKVTKDNAMSYLGVLSHCKNRKIKECVSNVLNS